MTRLIASPLPLAALLGGLALLQPGLAAAQSDPAARQLIEQLIPRGDAATRGIRLPATPAPEAAPAPAAPGAAPSAQMLAPPPTPSLLPMPPVVEGPPARPAATPGAISTATTAPPDVAAVSIIVTFASGSALLTAQAEQALAPLGRALSSPDLAPYRFRIEGHTDTVGDALLNQRLSERRAESVRTYLMTKHGVPAARLEAVGLGESVLLVPTGDNVAEPRNRRVQVLNIGG
jgi:outer membrane protein OmpA-like peptidoglycan-associated protein